MRDTRVQRRSNIHAQFRRGKWEFGAEERKEHDISATMSATQRARSPVVGEPEAGKSAEPGVAFHIDMSLVEKALRTGLLEHDRAAVRTMRVAHAAALRSITPDDRR